MPKKYHVDIKPTPPRFAPISKFSSFEIQRCLGCRTCVKNVSCVYRIYQKRGLDPYQVQDTGDYMCVNCLRCVQECRNNIFSRSLNPRYLALGDEHWTPDIIARLWRQAESGKIPVSGAGYRGPFAGPGFDRMWTDMSEIVRPTRDGIHGREYISTVIDIGRKPPRLEFNEEGEPVSPEARFVEVQIPVVLDLPELAFIKESARRAIARAAVKLKTLAVAEYEEANGILSEFKERLIVKFNPDKHSAEGLENAAAAELPFSPSVLEQAEKLRGIHPGMVVSVRVPLDEHAGERALKLFQEGADVVHLQASRDSRGLGAAGSKFSVDLLREVHFKLVDNSVREQATLLVSGGIAMAEHMAKAIICGVDGVGVDLALAAALECRLCRDCEEQDECPVLLDQVEEEWGEQRIVNLLGAWHSQLIEVMGAMGMREVRRLRGELGRAMFWEDLERENFEPLFGERKTMELLSSGNPGLDVVLRREEPEEEKPQVPEPPPKEQWRFAPAADLVEPCGSRFRNRISKFNVVITNACTHCGKCAQACKFGVLEKRGGFMARPRYHLCRGPEVCKAEGSFCVDSCPYDAIVVGPNPIWETFGDPRWTPDLLAATWLQAETGMPPVDSGYEWRVGASGGGFDRIHFRFPDSPPEPSLRPEDIDLSVPLNKRGDERPQVVIGFPVYGGGMSFGSISLATMLSRARAYKAFNSFTCTGEGGYPDELTAYDDHVITQVATGLFGVREETIQRVRIVEFKYAQGAKPGLGGHLLGDKVTPAVAKMREAVEGSALFSPFPFHSVYSVEDHKKHVDWIKAINPRALISVKVSTPTDVDMVAVGSYYAGAHIIHIDGSYGGTGAAPDIAKKNIAMPVEYAIPKVHRFLQEEGVREEMTLVASGGIRTAWDIAKAIALGADAVVIGTAELVALECVRCGNCESGRGCPRGIATTDPELSADYDVEWGSQRIINLFHSFAVQLQEILWRFGMRSIRELVGRSDLLYHQDYENLRKTG